VRKVTPIRRALTRLLWLSRSFRCQRSLSYGRSGDLMFPKPARLAHRARQRDQAHVPACSRNSGKARKRSSAAFGTLPRASFGMRYGAFMGVGHVIRLGHPQNELAKLHQKQTVPSLWAQSTSPERINIESSGLRSPGRYLRSASASMSARYFLKAAFGRRVSRFENECLTGDTKKNSLVLFIAREQDVVAGIALVTAAVLVTSSSPHASTRIKSSLRLSPVLICFDIRAA
jgi:hypothetical protein